MLLGKVIFADRRENFNDDRILQDLDSMLNSSGDAPAVAGFRFEQFISNFKPKFSGNHNPGLLVGMGMRRNLGPFCQAEFAHQCFFAVHERF